MEHPSMTTIRTTCPTCGEVKLTVADVALELLPGAQEGRYRFACPVCGTIRRRPANRRVVTILLATGVVSVDARVARPIDEAEIATFAAALGGPGWFKELVAQDS